MVTIVRPNVYVLGGTPEIDITPKDQGGVFFTPSLLRLSIKQPDGGIVTLSGGNPWNSGIYNLQAPTASGITGMYNIYAQDSSIVTLLAGASTTLSGANVILGSGMYTYLYRPPLVGWYEYESWVVDSSGREIAQTNGFEVIERVYWVPN